ncbi:MAG TPA: disulfide bond formation protein B [Burkholderiales bacterium]|nr:disulfide bond formation protein B [Burkholderiales bacterium]
MIGTPDKHRTATARALEQERGWTLVFVCWLVAASSTLAALFFSEVMNLPPCVLCWYQRIFIFPLVLLLPVGLFPFDPKIVRYALPLPLVGWPIALFHVLLTYGLIPESIKPCTQGVPCAQNQIEWFGFVSIPLLSLGAFSVINALLLMTRYKVSK